MTMKDIHAFCPQCKIRDQFYEDFNSDSKKNVSYFGVISYVNHYLLLDVSSQESKEELSKNSYKDVCFLQLLNEWSTRDLIAQKINEKNGLIKHLEEKKPCLKTPSFYLPDHAGNLITIKKSESFTESSPDDTICSVNFKETKNVDKCKLTKKCPTKKKVASKEPKNGTLKRKRWNLRKLKESEKHEDDLFEGKKFDRIIPELSSNSEDDKVYSPFWSIHLSPRVQSPAASYEDCYSPTELENIRKGAEEYQYRRSKRRKTVFVNKKINDSKVKMKQDLETYKTLEKACKKLKKLEKDGCESEEDNYFTDSDNSDT